MAIGAVDITMQYVGPSILQIDAGKPLIIVAGIQPGCFELFGTERIRSVRDLKGKTVAIEGFTASAYTFIASMMAYVGLDPRRDVTWAVIPPSDAKQTVCLAIGFRLEGSYRAGSPSISCWRDRRT